MRSEHAFATFRIAGADLLPDLVTKILDLPPDLKYAKGDKYRRGSRSPELTAKSGLWFFSTDKFKDASFEDHVNFLTKTIFSHEHDLQNLIRVTSSHAVLTIFWSGPAGSKKPIVPDDIIRSLSSIPVKVETDFDTDGGGLPPLSDGVTIPA
jgi:hypothetical protein